MKKVIRFSKAFLLSWIFSGVIIISGIVGIAVRGINFGIDFKPGLIEEIRIAPTALELTYTGSAKISVDASQTGMDIVISGTGADNRTESFLYAQYPTVGILAEKLGNIENLSARLIEPPATPTENLFVNSAVTTVLTEKPFRVYAAASKDVGINEVRTAVSSYSGVAVKQLGKGPNRSFQIRIADTGKNGSSKELQDTVTNALQQKFGIDNVAVVKTDFIGSQFSKSIVGQSLILMAATLILIWLYATIRFHWDFALGSIVALLHDTMIMLTFITWTQMEFSTTTLAAIMTIVGYSINATVVILDRVRDDMKILDVHGFNEVLDAALTETLSRSIITTVTTMFSAFSLYFFLTGSIEDFALVLLVGLTSGCYSSIFISSGLISFIRRNWKPEAGVHHTLPKEVKDKNVLSFDAGAQM